MCFQSIKKEITKCQETTELFISLLAICGKIFQRLIYDNLFEFFIKNNPNII